MDTLAGLIDRLFTVDMKMWDNQELLYAIRKMSFDEFKTTYFETEEGAKLLQEKLDAYLAGLDEQLKTMSDDIRRYAEQAIKQYKENIR